MDHIVKNIFIFVGPGGPSIIIVDPSCFSALLSPISIYVYKIQSMLFVHVWEVLGDHLLNPSYQSVSELRPHHNGAICTTRKITSSSYMGHDVIQMNNFGYLGGGALAMPGGGLQSSDWAYLCAHRSSHLC